MRRIRGRSLYAGGGGPTLDPEYFLKAGVDAAFRGEGEEALVEFVSALTEGDWRDCANISYRNGSKIVHNAMRPMIRDIDSLPFPLQNPRYFSCIECNQYFPRPMEKCGFQIQSFLAVGDFSVMTSRGCLGKCAYCSTEGLRQAYKDTPGTPKMRTRSLGNVMQELLGAKEHGAHFISFWDDLLIRKTEQLVSFFSEYKEKIGLPFFAQFHPQQLQNSPEIIDAAVEAGITQFYFGIQSGSPIFCKEIYHRNFFTDDYARLFSLIQNRQADILAQFIGANPLEKREHFEETLKFVASLPFDHTYTTSITIINYYLKYVPGSPLLQKYPELPSVPRSREAWFRDALLMDIRFIADDAAFDPIYAKYKDIGKYDDVMELREHRNEVYNRGFTEFFRPKIAKLEGQDVYFWGCGDLYHKNKEFLRGLNPKAILLDVPHSGPDVIDGIPVRHPSDVADKKPLPVIIFSGRPSYIFRKIRRDYPKLAKVIPCPHVLSNKLFEA